MLERQSQLSDALRSCRGVAHSRRRLVRSRGRHIPRVGVTHDRLSSCGVRVRLTHAAEEFGYVCLQLGDARGICDTALRYRGQDRKGIDFDLLQLRLGDIYHQIDPSLKARPLVS